MIKERSQIKARKMWDNATYYLQKGNPKKAYPLLWQMNRLMPSNPDVIYNLGACAYQTGRYDVAIKNLEKFLELKSDAPIDAFYALAFAYQEVNRHSDALALLQRVCGSTRDAKPRHLQAQLLLDLGRPKDASDVLRPMVDASDAGTETLDLYASSLSAQELNLAAAAILENLLSMDPNNISFRLRRSYSLLMAGKVPAAIQEYRNLLQMDQESSDSFSKLLYALHYLDDVDDATLAEEHDDWVSQYCLSGDADRIQINDVFEKRPLRIGYVSGDFCLHAVSSFFSPVLKAHDRSRVSIYCYSNSMISDWMTERLANDADHWRNIAEKSDDEFIKLVRSDKLDVLVDLSGHTPGNRLKAISQRLAPLQISWLGYPSPTKIPAIDYFICDEVTLAPLAVRDDSGGEKPLIVKGGFHCYSQPAKVDVAPLPPCFKNQFITFGSFNALAKISPTTLKLWSRVLIALPNSRLLLKRTPLAEKELRVSFKRQFADLGIESDRLYFLWELPSTAHHLEQYAEIDIALDTFPHNGTTTTCDALWMGVPVIAHLGENWVSRKSASLLRQAGLEFLIAHDHEEYVKIATSVASNQVRLANLRKNLRDKLLSSTLCDANRLAGALEDAFLKALKI